MKIAYVKGVNSNLDSTRGIGANTKMLLEALANFKNNKFKVVNSPRDADIIHYVKFHPFFISLPFTKPKNSKLVLTIHDLIPLIYPTHYPPGVKGNVRFLINKFLVKKNVDRIITISETSKKDICRFLGVKPDIVDVTYLAPKQVFEKLKIGAWVKEITNKYNLPQKFVLFDHGVNYNKNLPTLMEACKIAKIPLAVVGKETENIGKLDLNHPELSHLKGVDFSGVLKLGFVSDEDLNKLFNLAYIYIQPSFYEGFGMPVLEAMVVGCPVIASRTQAIVEVGGDACLYFNSSGVGDLVEKINMFKNDEKLRQEYIKRGFKQVKKYSWEKAAKETLGVYAKA